MIAVFIILLSLPSLIAAIIDKFMDKWMVEYQLLSEKDEYIVNPCWWSYNPLAKWKDGIWNSERAHNILLLKLGIKTTWLTDNCNDAWHFFKSILVGLIFVNVVSSVIIGAVMGIQPWWFYLVLFILLCVQWNIAFNKTEHKFFK